MIPHPHAARCVAVGLLGTGFLAALGFRVAAAAGAEPGGRGKKAAAVLMCPVMPNAPIVDKKSAGSVTVNNEPVYLCCATCIWEMKTQPMKYLKRAKDPVTGKPFAVSVKTPMTEHGGGVFLFAGAKTQKTFQAAPGRYVRQAKKPAVGTQEKQ